MSEKGHKWFKKVTEKDKILHDANDRKNHDKVLNGIRRKGKRKLEEERDFETLFLKHIDERRKIFEDVMRRGGLNRRIDMYVLNVAECAMLSGLIKIGGNFYLGCNGYFESITFKTVFDAIYRSLMFLGVGATEAIKTPSLALKSMEDYTANVNVNVIRFSNCFYDYDKGIKRVLSVGGICMYSVPWRYKANTCPRMFFTFLDRVLPNENDRRTIQEFFSLVYIDRSKISIEKFLILIGGGSNGKSVLLNIISEVVGKKYISHLDPNQLKDYKQIVEMSGKKLNIAPDVRSSAMMSSAMKTLVSGERVEAWEMYRGMKTIISPPLVFSMNELPKTEDNSNGMVRRMLPVFFSVTIPEEEQDKELANKIIASELSGVFDWLMEGRKRLLSNKGSFSRSERSIALGGEILSYSVPIIALLQQRDLYREPKYVGQEAQDVRAKDVIDMFKLDNATTTVANNLRSAGFKSRVINGHIFFQMYKG
jgi:P4 family phage/plasmid primase-like protien